MGGIGLPGDNSSAARYVRAVFTKLNSKCKAEETEAIAQYFHILNTVCQVNGCTNIGNQYEKTLYSSCCNTDKGIYYYTTYENPQISSVHLHRAELNSSALISYELIRKMDIKTAL